MIRHALVAALLGCGSFLSAGSITDLTEWTEIADPPHPGMTTTPPGANAATLIATGAIPSGTDIGYASVDGPDVAGSTQGYYFDPASDFSIAIDYTLTLQNLSGAGGIGLGIGEDAAGTDSAGIGVGFANAGLGDLLLFATAGRVGDVDQGTSFLNTAGTATGRLFVEYFAAAGDVTVGVSTTPGAASPTETRVLAAIQNQWDDEPLLVSFFLRSQQASLTTPIPVTVPAMSAGTATSVFSNFEVLSGTPITLVPEPTAASLLAFSMAAGLSRRR